jgi:hypothetical protein
MNTPKHLYRSTDGARFTRQPNGKYSMDSSQMIPKYEYGITLLLDKGFVNSLEECKIEQLVSQNDGHGNEELDCHG